MNKNIISITVRFIIHFRVNLRLKVQTLERPGSFLIIVSPVRFPGAKRGYYGFVVVRVRRDFLLATYSPHFFPDFFHIWQVA